MELGCVKKSIAIKQLFALTEDNGSQVLMISVINLGVSFHYTLEYSFHAIGLYNFYGII